MIHLIERFNLQPASPATRDRFVALAEGQWLPALAEHGGQPTGAWFCNEHWFSQVVHATRFTDAAACAAYRGAAAADGALGKAYAEFRALAPEQSVEQLETFGPVPDEALEAGFAKSAEKPAGAYTFAILDVVPDAMPKFRAMLEGAAKNLPIVGAWRRTSGNPNEVIDLWRGDVAQGYAPNSPEQEAFFGPLRELVPRERMERLFPLPYSPLR